MPFTPEEYRYRRPRAPYGIKEPGTMPMSTPWHVRLWDLLSQKSAQVRARYQQTNTSGQIPATRDAYATHQQATWHRPTQPKADPITQVGRAPTEIERQWPTWPGSRFTPLNRTFRMDPRPQTMGHLRPAELPTDERMSGGGAQFKPKSLRYRQDFLPVRINDTTMPLGVTGLAIGSRLVRPYRYGMALMGGINQHGTRQTWGQWGNSIVIAPPVWSRTNQGVRSVGGVMFRDKQSTGRTRVPAVFTPSSVQ